MQVSFETWHVYGTDRMYPLASPWNIKSSNFSEPLDTNFEFEMKKGKEIQSFLEARFWQCKRIWFHDDVMPRIKQKVSSDSWRWQHFMNVTKQQVHDRLNLEGGQIFEEQSEFDLTWDAINFSIPDIVSAIEDNELWRYDSTRKMLRWPKKNNKQQRIRLYWYRTYSDIPSCEVLDYTFYVKRLQDDSPTITLIHESMMDQQSRVRKLFELQWLHPEVIVLFHDGEKISWAHHWWKDPRNEELKEELRIL